MERSTVLDVLLSSITHESPVHLESSVLHPQPIRATRALPAPEPKVSDDRSVTTASNISNVGHLGLVRSQRNALHSQLHVQQTATAEAKRSVTSLRKLALRLAVHISVKEARLASHARALANSRLSQYVIQRNQQAQVDKLASALRENEQQAQQLLEALNKAAPLPLTPPLEAQNAPPSVLSPPPSPGSRKAHLAVIPWTPNAVASASSSSSTSTSPSPDPIAAARRHIEALQHSFQSSQVDVRSLERNEIRLREIIREYEDKVNILDTSRSRLVRELDASKENLLRLSASQTRLRNEYDAEKQKTRDLSRVCEETQGKVTELEQSRLAVEADVHHFSQRVQELESSNSELTAELEQAKQATEDLKEELAKLQDSKSTVEQELEAAMGSKEILESRMSSLSESEHGVVEELNNLRVRLMAFEKAHAESQAIIRSLESRKISLQEELRVAKTNLSVTYGSEAELRSQLDGLHQREFSLENQLSHALARLQSIERTYSESRATIGSLELEKNSIDEELRVTKFRLSAATDIEDKLQSELTTLQKREGELEQDLIFSKTAVSKLELNLDAAHTKMDAMGESIRLLTERLEASEASKAQFERAAKLAKQSRARIEAHLQAVKKDKQKVQAGLGSVKTRLVASEVSKMHLEARLSLTEKELAAALERNDKLENMLDKTESDLAAVEATTTACEAQLEAFVDESRAKLAAAEKANAEMASSKAKVEDQLAEHKTEIRSLQQANNDLQAKLAAMTEELDKIKSGRLSPALPSQDAWHHEDCQLGKSPDFMTAAEFFNLELNDLKDTQHAFNKVVTTLHERSEQLQMLQEWAGDDEEAIWIDEQDSPPPSRPTSGVSEAIELAYPATPSGLDAVPEASILQTPPRNVGKARNANTVRHEVQSGDKRKRNVLQKSRPSSLKGGNLRSVSDTAVNNQRVVGVYDPVTKTWKTQSATRKVPPRTTSRPQVQMPARDQAVETYDPVTKTWKITAPAKVAPPPKSASRPKPSTTNPGTYDPETRTWKVGGPPQSKQPRSRSSTPSDTSSGVYDPETKTWSFTGKTKAAKSVAARGGVETYDPITKTWAVAAAPRPKTPRSAKGGVESYDPITKTWTVTEAPRSSTPKQPKGGVEMYDPITKKWTITPAAPQKTLPPRPSSGAKEPVFDPITRTWTVSSPRSSRSHTRTRSSSTFSDDWDPQSKSWNKTAPLSPYGSRSRDFDEEIENCAAEVGDFDYDKRVWSLFPKAPKPQKKEKPSPVEGYAEFDPVTRKWIVKPVPHLEQVGKGKSRARPPMEEESNEDDQERHDKEHTDAVASVGQFDPVTKKWSLFGVRKTAKKPKSGGNIGTWDPVTKTWTADNQDQDDDDDEEEKGRTGMYDPFKKTWSFFTKSGKKKPKDRHMVENAQRTVGAYDPVTRKWTAPEHVRPHSASVKSVDVSSHDGDNEGERVVERIPVVEEPEAEDADPGVYDPITGTWHASNPQGAATNSSEESLVHNITHGLDDPGIYNPETGTWDNMADGSERPPSQMSQVDGHIVPAIGDYDPETRAWNSANSLNSPAPAPEVQRYPTGSSGRHSGVRNQNSNQYRPKYRPRISPEPQQLGGKTPVSPTSATYSGRSYMNVDDDGIRRNWGGFWRKGPEKLSFPSPPVSHNSRTAPTLALNAGIGPTMKKEKKGWTSKFGKKAKALESNGQNNSECVVQ